MKQAILLTLLCFSSSLLGSAVTLIVWPKPAQSDEAIDQEVVAEETAPVAAVPSEITARKLVLVDARGRVRIVLAALDQEDPDVKHEITLFDEKGVSRLVAGLDKQEDPYIELSNSSLPNPGHKRISLSVDSRKAKLELGHGEVEEVVLQSAQPSDSTENQIRLRARNGSSTTMYVNEFGHATVEVKDFTDQSVLRVPQWQPLFPESEEK